jgi:cardiolipin synthase
MALLVFCVSSLTDFLDGYLARKLNGESEFGKIIDPLADKTLIISSYFLFAYLRFIPIYLTVVVISRDILILCAVLLCRTKKIPLKIKPLLSSKINTTLQMLYIIFVLSCKCFSITVSLLLIDVCSLVVCISTVFSAVEYAKEYYWIRNAICKSQ